MVKDVKLGYLDFEDGDVGDEIKRRAQYQLADKASLIAYVDHLE